MADDPLTYRDSGVDVEANLGANRRILGYARRTYDERVCTRGGLFGGAIRVGKMLRSFEQPVLAGRLSGTDRPDEAEQAVPAEHTVPAERRGPEQRARQVAELFRRKTQRAWKPLAFLDYLAAARLDPQRAADLVGIFSRAFAQRPKIPIIGGETAEMPDVFRAEAWEVVGALFALTEAGSASGPSKPLSGLQGLERPVLVFSMDGVGTKTKLGVMTARTSGLALDIIHHSLDDILCQGARGLAMMLYVGCCGGEERLVRPLLDAAEACCRRNRMVLLDVTVAEKPELYLPGEIDVCGAIAGVVEEKSLLQGEAIRAGDVLIGIGSSGLHTNGYSLARKALLERGGLQIEHYVEEIGAPLADALLEPHTNYAPAVLPLLEGGESAVRGIAHITGGGLQDNLERILPAELRAEIRLSSWRPPPIFELIRRCGNIPLQDPVGKGMYESFNMGIGMVLVVPPERAEEVLERLRGSGFEGTRIGEILQAEERLQAEEGPNESASDRVRLL